MSALLDNQNSDKTAATASVAKESNEKPLKLVIVGHVDHGKSTLIGRILHDTGSLEQGRIEKVRRICEEQHKPFELAFLLDALEEEQLQGITIDTTQINFHTQTRNFQIIDAPGHKEFLKNMISGAANADAAVLMIDAHEGIREQSRRHGYLLSLLGIHNVVVVVNKMDLVGYRQEAFEAVRTEYLAFLKGLGIVPRRVIPVSAREGDNVVTASDNLAWYTGVPLLSELEKLTVKEQRQTDGLRLCVQDVYKFDDRRIIAGRVESGAIRVGDAIEILPTGHRAHVQSIECWPKPEEGPYTRVDAGFTVGITLDEQLFVDRGHIIVHPGNGPKPTRFVTANIFWMNGAPLVHGRRYKLKIGPQETGAFVHRINRVLNSATIEMTANASEVGRHEVGEVVFRTEQNLAVDAFDQFTHTGRLVVVDGYDVAGGGIILNAGLGRAEEMIGPVTPAERERVNGHHAGIIRLMSNENPSSALLDASTLDEGREVLLLHQLERMLFNAGFRTYALRPNASECSAAAFLSQTLGALLDAGLLVLLPAEIAIPAGLSGAGDTALKTFTLRADWPADPASAETRRLLETQLPLVRDAFAVYLDEASGI